MLMCEHAYKMTEGLCDTLTLRTEEHCSSVKQTPENTLPKLKIRKTIT